MAKNKPKLLADWYLTHGVARGLAESLWGKGGTTADKCNRLGVFYFSCSGHGGYIVDAEVLTVGERTRVESLLTEDSLDLLVQKRSQGDVVIGVSNPYSLRQHSHKYNPALGPIRWEKRAIFIAEEDCDWAIIEEHTIIRCAWSAQREAENPTEARASRRQTLEAAIRYKEEAKAAQNT